MKFSKLIIWCYPLPDGIGKELTNKETQRLMSDDELWWLLGYVLFIVLIVINTLLLPAIIPMRLFGHFILKGIKPSSLMVRK